MDPQNLGTASAYINNLLLARGLLRNGTPIEFADPVKSKGGLDATMAQVMSLIHDMVLRRDREADTLSTLSQTIHTLRASSSQLAQKISSLETKRSDLSRDLAFSATQERSARAALKGAETRNRALREDLSRLKTTVIQVRGQCANDIRRRDGEIGRLKKHLEGRRGREGNGGQVGVAVVTPRTSRGPKRESGSENEVDLDSPQYSLKQETTEFLTQLSQSLSDENDSLIGLAQTSLATLRILQGLPNPSPRNNWREPKLRSGCDENSNAGMIFPTSFETLATDMGEVLEHLRSLLTNPSFVPIEEVIVREDEIVRLREGWEKMEIRWQEAVALMDGWRRRMMDTGDTINLEDLKMGLNLGSGLSVPTEGYIADSKLIEPDSAEQGSIVNEGEEGGIEDSVDIAEGNPGGSPRADEPGNDNTSREAPGGPALLEARSNILRPRSGNRRPTTSPKKVSFNTTQKRSNEDCSDEVALLDLSDIESISPRGVEHSPFKLRCKAQKPVTSLLTVQQKLDRVRVEAEEARQREQKTSPTEREARRTIGKASRRRSTLSPEELEVLMGIGG